VIRTVSSKIPVRNVPLVLAVAGVKKDLMRGIVKGSTSGINFFFFYFFFLLIFSLSLSRQVSFFLLLFFV
jgi:hypothetical protein